MFPLICVKVKTRREFLSTTRRISILSPVQRGLRYKGLFLMHSGGTRIEKFLGLALLYEKSASEGAFTPAPLILKLMSIPV